MTPVLVAICTIIAAGAVGPVLKNDKRGIAPILIAVVAATGFFVVLAGFGQFNPPVQLLIGNWPLPYAQLLVGIDSLTAWFLLPLFLLTSCSALFGKQYLEGHGDNGVHWLWFGLFAGAMALVLLARNAVFFLLAWEIMSLSSFLLILYGKADRATAKAAWTYLVATHMGTAFILLAFLVLFAHTGSFDFMVWEGSAIPRATAAFVFISALLGFGTKAGLIPFHVWLPVAHPAAPSHVSALMSGVMIKMGIYGLIRVLTFLQPWPEWWGMVLLAIGAISGILGVLFALGQHELKRLLAFHSVENVGIIALGLGLGMLGAAYHAPAVLAFGFAGGLLHIFNHAIFKGLLFLCAGAVIRCTGTGEIDLLGGLIRSMPVVATTFLVGSVAICGLPFFNGFVSELMIYRGSLQALISTPGAVMPIVGLCAGASLALIGGLAVACFTKAFGTVFLGEPRSATTVHGDAGLLMKLTMIGLALASLAIGLGSWLLSGPMIAAVAAITGSAVADAASVPVLLGWTGLILLTGLAVLAIVAFLYMLRVRPCRTAGAATWDCGYARPSPRMQYTASSFAAPIVSHFGRILSLKSEEKRTEETFPALPWKFHSSVPDWFMSRIYGPLFGAVDHGLSRLRCLQSGRTGHYVLFIALAVMSLILWKFIL